MGRYKPGDLFVIAEKGKQSHVQLIEVKSDKESGIGVLLLETAVCLPARLSSLDNVIKELHQLFPAARIIPKARLKWR
ncbi:hypothetical protein [Listeria ilorinensis]|uniref:hypothetical protein n=1 Tax=Listeria ilorinensis TaxID=2867439 RepID=UPI001EF427B9|nr:hypothetical protein [Listeria ilorinensis]